MYIVRAVGYKSLQSFLKWHMPQLDDIASTSHKQAWNEHVKWIEIFLLQ